MQVQWEAAMASYDFGFVLEQALGHITHSKNLQVNVPRDKDVRPHWALIDFAVEGASARIPIYNSNWTVRAGLRARRQLSELSKTTKLDALLFNTQVPAILAQRWLHRIPSIVSLDATPLQYDQFGDVYQHARGNAALEALKWRLNRDCYKAARRLVAWGAWTKRGLVDAYEVPEDKVDVIAPGVTTREWQRPTPRTLHDDPVKILFVGGNLERKGGSHLIAAFRALRHLGIELHLVTKDTVAPEPGLFVYNGLSPNSQPLKDLYHACDIFALPTFGDTQPLVLSEAGAGGMAVVSTNIAAIPEIVRNGETGITVEPGDTAGLTEALRRLVTAHDFRLSLGANLMALVHREFDAETNARRLLDLLKKEADMARFHARSGHST
jgi:glycosyltransferase involved in cell wall biosynthesis